MYFLDGDTLSKLDSVTKSSDPRITEVKVVLNVTDKRTVEQIDGETKKRTEKFMDKRTEKLMDKRTDRQTDR